MEKGIVNFQEDHGPYFFGWPAALMGSVCPRALLSFKLIVSYVYETP